MTVRDPFPEDTPPGPAAFLSRCHSVGPLQVIDVGVDGWGRNLREPIHRLAMALPPLSYII